MRFLLLIICILSFYVVSSQKYALVGDTSNFICKSDSIISIFKKEYLEVSQIDTLIKVHYFYDNGRDEDEIQAFIWQKEGILNVKIVLGCDVTSETKILEYKDIDVFMSYFDQELPNQEHILDSSWSHEFGYFFSIEQGEYFKKGYIRDSRRGKDDLVDRNKKEAKKLLEEAEKNGLIKWINRIDNYLLEELKKQ